MAFDTQWSREFGSPEPRSGSSTCPVHSLILTGWFFLRPISDSFCLTPPFRGAHVRLMACFRGSHSMLLGSVGIFPMTCSFRRGLGSWLRICSTMMYMENTLFIKVPPVEWCKDSGENLRIKHQCANLHSTLQGHINVLQATIRHGRVLPDEWLLWSEAQQGSYSSHVPGRAVNIQHKTISLVVCGWPWSMTDKERAF